MHIGKYIFVPVLGNLLGITFCVFSVLFSSSGSIISSGFSSTSSFYVPSVDGGTSCVSSTTVKSKVFCAIIVSEFPLSINFNVIL